MFTQDQLQHVVGSTAYDRDGNKVGKVGNVYYDDNTDEPKWITVNTGLFGTNENFVPVQGAELREDRVTVAYDESTIKNAPDVAEDGHLSAAQEQQLYQYYNLEYDGTGTEDIHSAGFATGRHDYDAVDTATGQHALADDRASYDRDRSTGGGVVSGEFAGREHDAIGRDTSDAAMTRSEERLEVGTETREAGRARLRKHVVTEREQVSVPVSHEELRVEREPITDANRGDAYDGVEITEAEHEITLHAERPVVETRVEAVERVRLGTETVREEETVSGEVRKERIDVEDDVRTTSEVDGENNRR